MTHRHSLLFVFPLLPALLLAGCATAGQTTPRDCSVVPSALVDTFGSKDGYLSYVKANKSAQTQKISLADDYLTRPDQTEAGKLFFLQTRADTYSAMGQDRLAIADYKTLAALPGIAEDRRQYFRRIADTGVTPLSSLALTLPENETDAAPLVRIPPIFPPAFLQKDNSGHCALKFDVDTTGKAVNGVIEYCTDDILRETSLKSLDRWRFSPKTVEGKAVLRENSQTRIRYSLQDQCGFLFPE